MRRFRWMRVISRRSLREFWGTHPQAEAPLDNWYRIASRAAWQNLVEVQNDFPHADLVGNLIVFNIGGNNYRLAVKIEFIKQLIFVKYVLTHRDYTRIFT